MSEADDELMPSREALQPAPRKTIPQSTTEEGIRQEERIYASFVDHPGWAQFERDVRAEIMSLRLMDNAAIEGKSMEEVGKIFLVAREAADRMERVMDKVILIADAVKEQESDRTVATPPRTP